MSAGDPAMHVARNRRSYVAKSGERRVYESVLLRRSYRDSGKVKHETLANLKPLPEQAVAALEASLKGHQLVPADEAFTITRSLPHGHVAAVTAMARTLGLPELLGPPCRGRDVAFGLLIARVLQPASKPSTVTNWHDSTLPVDLALAGVGTDEAYQAMDWLADQQETIEKRLADKHLTSEANPSGMALFDLTSAWMEGTACPLAERGYSRDDKKGKTQIEYGLLTDPDGRPVAVRVFSGSIGDPAAFSQIVQVVRDQFGLSELVMVGTGE